MNEENQENNNLQKKDLGDYKYIYIVGLMAILFIFSYLFNFRGIGRLSLIGFGILCFYLIISASDIKESISLIRKDTAKDPKYYYSFLKKYVEDVKRPRLSLDLIWNKNFIYYPIEKPTLIFLDLYDRLENQDYVGIVKIREKDEQFRGLIPYSWTDFIKNRWFRFKMAGFASSNEGQITYVNKEGQPVSVPSDYYELLKDQGMLK